MEAKETNVVRIGSLELHFLVTDKAATVFEFVVPPQARVPAPHYHNDADEIMYGLEGIMTITVDGDKRELHKGDAIFIPRGSTHYHQNLHDGTARALSTITPGAIGRDYFEQIAEVVNAPGKPDLAKVQEIMLRHGLVPAV